MRAGTRKIILELHRKDSSMKKKRFFFFVHLLFALLPVIALAEESIYRIGPGDVLEISVWKDESLSRQVVVPPDGVISFPLIGDIELSNLTVKSLRKTVTSKLSEYVPDATVTVMLLQINSLHAYVIGKVNQPGQFPISMDTNVMQILSMAGGLNPFASPNKIIVLRQKNGKNSRIPFDYDRVKKGENLEQNIIVKRGDVIVVP
jgi:polysaccharide export outer membrane protein